MDGCNFDLGGTQLTALPSGALWWADMSALIVSDLHLGRSQRIARLGGGLLPPYEVADTLLRLDQDIAAARPRLVICLGDTFDDAQAANLAPDHALWLTRLMAGRRWVWIEGNHDPGPLYVGGEHRAELTLPPLTFRHIAQSGALAEVSGHGLFGVVAGEVGTEGEEEEDGHDVAEDDGLGVAEVELDGDPEVVEEAFHVRWRD